MKILLFILLLCSGNLSAGNLALFVGGQSNARGNMTSIPGGYNTPISKVFLWTGSAWVNYCQICNAVNFPNDKNYAGMEASFANDLIQRGYYDTVFLVKYTIGGAWLFDTTVANGSWNISRVGDIWDAAQVFYLAAYNNLAIHNISQWIFFWWQGESDGSLQYTANAYETNLTNFINAVKSEVYSGFTFWVMRINTNATNYPFRETIRTAETNVCSTGGYTLKTCDTYSCPDGAHLIQGQYFDLGIDLARQHKPLVNTYKTVKAFH